jgi:cobalt-zinc-cadmium efflux system protein
MHDHSHHHHHTIDTRQVSRFLAIGIGVNLAYVVLELLAGWWYGSLALLTDAGHNFADVSGLVLALLAFRLMRVKETPGNTFGHRKYSILISLINSLLLMLAVGMIIREAILRLQQPMETIGLQISLVAGIGVIINFMTAFLFYRDRNKDLNIRSAYWHMLADGLVSVGVIITGVVIHYSGWLWFDPLMSLIIAAVILASTWDLLRQSLRLTVGAIPAGIDLAEVRQKLLAIAHVADVHHVHIWPLSTTETAFTGHIVATCGDFAEWAELRQQIRDVLVQQGIGHITLEFENESVPRLNGDCCS